MADTANPAAQPDAGEQTDYAYTLLGWAERLKHVLTSAGFEGFGTTTAAALQEFAKERDALLARLKGAEEDRDENQAEIGLLEASQQQWYDAARQFERQARAAEARVTALEAALREAKPVLQAVAAGGAKFGPVYSHALTALHKIDAALATEAPATTGVDDDETTQCRWPDCDCGLSTETRVHVPCPAGRPTPEERVGEESLASINTDDADWQTVLAVVGGCAASWEAGARLLGNVRAIDIVRACNTALHPSLRATPAPVDRAMEALRADFTKVLPGGVLDDATYGAIEDALDRIEAPICAPDGRWLKLHERIAALSAEQTQPAGVVG